MTFQKWMNDMPQQFLGKKNIEILVKAFSRQIDELLQVYDDLKYATNLETAKGQNLMYIGDILSTSIKEAQSILMKANNDVITDELYRKILQYKTLQNNCDCTYTDIMESITLLWDADNISYIEDPNSPATVYISLPEASIDGIDPAVGRVLAIKPAGVAMIYTVGYAIGFNISGIEKAKLPKVILKLIGQEMVKEQCSVSNVRIKVDSNIDESVTVSLLLSKDLWFLDGTYLLDGTKTLSAHIEEEVL